MKVMNGPEAEVRVGNCLPLSEIPVGTQIHNIEPVSYTHLDVYKRQDLERYYDICHKAYERIFERVGLPEVISVGSDSGMMGGRCV